MLGKALIFRYNSQSWAWLFFWIFKMLFYDIAQRFVILVLHAIYILKSASNRYVLQTNPHWIGVLEIHDDDY